MMIARRLKTDSVSRLIVGMIYLAITLIALLMHKWLFSAILFVLPAVVFMIKSPQMLIIYQIVYNCLIKFLISTLHLPYWTNYLTDVFLILLVVSTALYINKRNIYEMCKDNIFKIPALFITAYFFLALVSLSVNKGNILTYLWNFRNTYRFFVFFVCCAMIISAKDIAKTINILFVLLWLDLGLAAIQFVLQKKRSGDLINGIFGTMIGYNAYSNVFLCTLAICGVLLFIAYQKRSTFLFASSIIIGLIIATISEIKAFYIEVVIIIVIAAVIIKPNRRTVVMLASVAGGIIISIPLLYCFYPSFRDFFNVKTIITYIAARGYSNVENLNRVTAIPTLASMFFKGKPFQLLFGIGPGNAEYSQFAAFSSHFYQLHGQTLDYNWFSDAYVFLENGLLGLLTYLCFFISIFIISFKIQCKSTLSLCYRAMAQITAALSIFYIFYSAALRAEGSGYLVFFFLAIPLSLRREEYLKIHPSQRNIQWLSRVDRALDYKKIAFSVSTIFQKVRNITH